MIKKIFYMGCCVVVFFFFVSCTSFPANMRYYVKDNITFSASLISNDPRRYNSLEIGTLEDPFFENIPPFVFQLNEEIVSSTNINISSFEKLSTSESDPRYIGSEWPKGTRCLFLPGYGILIHEEKILVFYVMNSKESSEPAPRIGAIDKKDLHILPLSEEEVIEIFGEEGEFKEFFMQ
jgi:hypothetical protein